MGGAAGGHQARGAVWGPAVPHGLVPGLDRPHGAWPWSVRDVARRRIAYRATEQGAAYQFRLRVFESGPVDLIVKVGQRHERSVLARAIGKVLPVRAAQAGCSAISR